MIKGPKYYKSTLIISSILFVFLLGGCGSVYDQVSDVKKEPSETKAKSFSEVVAELNTPGKVYSWMGKNIRYKTDESYADEFRDPEMTFALKYGDCDDYAVLADYILKKHGYDSQVVSVFTSEAGHTVCVWKDAAGKYNHLSNSSIRLISADKLENVANDVYANWKVYSIYPDNQGIVNPAAN